MTSVAEPLEINASGNTAVVNFHLPWLHNQQPLTEAYKRIAQLIEGGLRELVFDLSEVENLSSSTLGYFFGFASRLRELEGTLYLIRMSRPVFMSLKVVQLDRVAEIEPPEGEALNKRTNKQRS